MSSAIEERQKKEKFAVLAALKEMPIVHVACKRVGVGRATYYRWKQEDPAFARESENALQQGIEFINDMSESQLITLIKEKKMPAIALWLKHNHDRYGSKQTQRGSRIYPPILTDEEQEVVLKALELASGGDLTESHDKLRSNTPQPDQEQQEA